MTARFCALLLLLVMVVLAAPAHSALGDGGAIDTKIVSGPSDGATVYNDAVSFGFVASGGPSPGGPYDFECAMDSAPPAPCASGQFFEDLEEGRHVFSVFAVSAGGGPRDETPATRSFVIEEFECGDEPPETQEEAEECAPEKDETASECVLRSARARAVADLRHSSLHLLISYTARAPTGVEVETRFGGVRLPAARRHLSMLGRLVLRADLPKGELARARAARQVVVKLDVPGASAPCAGLETRKLTVKRAAARRVIWTQPRS